MSGLIILLIIFFTILYFWSKRKKPAGKETIRKIVYPQNLALSLVLIVLGINVFIYKTYMGIGTSLFCTTSLIAVYLSMKKEKQTKFVKSLMAVGILTTAMIGVRANYFIQDFNFTVAALVVGLMIFVNTVENFQAKGLFILNKIKHILFELPQQTVLLFKQSKIKEKGSKPIISTILKTTIFTLILVVFFAALLSSADPVFSKIIENFMEEAVGRVVVSLLAVIGTVVVLTLKLKKIENEEYKFKALEFTEIFIPVVSLVALFAVFIFVQIKYLFSSHANFLDFDITYSEYVRKGFKELLITTFFGSLIVYAIILKKKVLAKAQQIKQFSILNSALILELFFILASAFKRDVMYVEVYGLTRIRIIGGVYLVWLAILLGLLLVLSISKKMQEKHLFMGVYIASIAVVASLNIFNVDKIIADYQPLDTFKNKDYFYINNLSADAYEGWKESIDQIEDSMGDLMGKKWLDKDERKVLATHKLALISLQEKRDALEQKYGDAETVMDKYYADYDELPDRIVKRRKWQSFNWSEFQAYTMINDVANRNLFYDRLDDLVTSIERYQVDNQIDLYEEEWWRMKEFDYPFMNMRHEYYPQNLRSLERNTAPAPRGVR